MLRVGGAAVVERRVDPDQRRMAQRGRGKITHSVVVSTLPLASVWTWKCCCFGVRECFVGLAFPPLTQRLIRVPVESK